MSFASRLIPVGLACLLAGAVTLASTAGWAATAADEPRWMEAAPSAAQDVARGRPLVVRVIVPLCHNAQIDCGPHGLGNPGNLRTNLYWGALFGARRFFDRPELGYERVAVDSGPSDGAPWLERVVYRRWIPAGHWSAGSRPAIEQLVVLEAFHGDDIDLAVDHFWSLAGRGGSVAFRDGAELRSERVHVVGYVGHDRLMDGHRLPPPPPPAEAHPIPSFVLACFSERYFGEALRAVGSSTLVTTRSYVAPEGYCLEAAVRALGAAEPAAAVRAAVVDAYARWQRVPVIQAWRYFER